MEGSIAMSSKEAEHKTAIEALQEIIWLKELLRQIESEQLKTFSSIYSIHDGTCE